MRLVRRLFALQYLVKRELVFGHGLEVTIDVSGSFGEDDERGAGVARLLRAKGFKETLLSVEKGKPTLAHALRCNSPPHGRARASRR